jgi:hypothetical protein
MKTKNKTTELTELIPADQLDQWYIKYRQRHGWWLVCVEPRHLGDDGTFLGVDWKHAKKTLEAMF